MLQGPKPCIGLSPNDLSAVYSSIESTLGLRRLGGRYASDTANAVRLLARTAGPGRKKKQA